MTNYSVFKNVFSLKSLCTFLHKGQYWYSNILYYNCHQSFTVRLSLGQFDGFQSSFLCLRR